MFWNSITYKYKDDDEYAKSLDKTINKTWSNRKNKHKRKSHYLVPAVLRNPVVYEVHETPETQPSASPPPQTENGNDEQPSLLPAISHSPSLQQTAIIDFRTQFCHATKQVATTAHRTGNTHSNFSLVRISKPQKLRVATSSDNIGAADNIDLQNESLNKFLQMVAENAGSSPSASPRSPSPKRGEGFTSSAGDASGQYGSFLSKDKAEALSVKKKREEIAMQNRIQKVFLMQEEELAKRAQAIDDRKQKQVERFLRAKRQEEEERRELWARYIVIINGWVRIQSLHETRRARHIMSFFFLPRWRARCQLKIARICRRFLKGVYTQNIMRRPTIHALKRISFFAAWSGSVLARVSRLLQPVVYLRGEVIAYEGDIGFCMWILDDGQVGIYVRDKKSTSKSRNVKNSIYITSLKNRGIHFGEFSLLSDEPRMATLYAEARTCLWQLASVDMFWCMDILPPEVKQIVANNSDDRRKANMSKLYTLSIAQVRQNEVFAEWPMGAIQEILDHMLPFVFNEGDQIAQQGETAEGLYFCARGKIQLYQTVTVKPRRQSNSSQQADQCMQDSNNNVVNSNETPAELRQRQESMVLGERDDTQELSNMSMSMSVIQTKEKNVKEITAPTMFGESAVFFLEPLPYSAKSVSKSEVWFIGKQHIHDVLMKNPDWFIKSKIHLNNMRALHLPPLPVSHLKASRILPEIIGVCNDINLKRLASYMFARIVDKTDTIVTHGSKQTELFFILRGKVKVSGADKPLTTGDYFGSYAYNEPESTWKGTYTALERVDLWVLARYQFFRFLEEYDEIVKQVILTREPPPKRKLAKGETAPKLIALPLSMQVTESQQRQIGDLSTAALVAKLAKKMRKDSSPATPQLRPVDGSSSTNLKKPNEQQPGSRKGADDKPQGQTPKSLPKQKRKPNKSPNGTNGISSTAKELLSAVGDGTLVPAEYRGST